VNNIPEAGYWPYKEAGVKELLGEILDLPQAWMETTDTQLLEE